MRLIGAKDPSLHHADSEDSDQTGRMPRHPPSLNWADAQASAQSDLSVRWAHTHFVGFVMS